MHQVCHETGRITHSQKAFVPVFHAICLFVVVWNSPSRAELRTRIDDLSEAEEYVVFVSVCSGQMCSCNFSVSKNFLGGLSAVTTKGVKPVCNGRKEKRKALQHGYLIRSPSPSLNWVCLGGAGEQ